MKWPVTAFSLDLASHIVVYPTLWYSLSRGGLRGACTNWQETTLTACFVTFKVTFSTHHRGARSSQVWAESEKEDARIPGVEKAKGADTDTYISFWLTGTTFTCCSFWTKMNRRI